EQIIIPEKEFNMAEVADTIQKGRERGKKHSIIILAEGVMSGNDFAEQLAEFGDHHARVTVLGHVQRGGSPTARDRVLASIFGAKAVDLLKEGKGGLGLGMVGNKIVENEFEDVLNNQKHMPDLSLYKLNQEVSY
ncbi:MAG: 6-phosphofructokinase, partial [Carnobacterium sp.]